MSTTKSTKGSKTLKDWLDAHNHDWSWLRAQVSEIKSRQHARVIVLRIQRPSAPIAYRIEDLTGGEVSARHLLLDPLPRREGGQAA
jgi:hypothetical protein